MTISLRGRLEVPMEDPDWFFEELSRHLKDRIPLGAGPDGEIVMPVYGQIARLRFADGQLGIDLEGDDVARHAIAKGTVSFYVQAVFAERCPPLVWTGDGAGATELPHFRELRVVSTEAIGPSMRRVHLLGQDLGRYASGGLHVRLLFPPEGRVPVWPKAGPAALPIWPDGEDTLRTRVYTIRSVDPEAGRLAVDVVLHDPPGTGCRWARTAQPGDRVGMLGPGGGDVPKAAWVLVLGDESALPAIARSLEEMAPDRRGSVFIEVDGPSDEMPLVHPEGVSLRWLHRQGRQAGSTSLLIDAARSVDWPDERDVFVWAGAEFETFKEIRRFCRKDRGLKTKQHLVVAYWRRGQDQDTAERKSDDD